MQEYTLTIALDIGGTFTDMVAVDETTGEIHHSKSSTTPSNLATGIRECLVKSGLPLGSATSFVHGSTTAINTAIERTGARTALFVTNGMRDVYKIGRGNRPEAYNLFFKRPEPYVPRHLTYEIGERMTAAGEVLVEFDAAQAQAAAEKARQAGVEAVAVCFIHAWANPDHESRMGRILSEVFPQAHVSLSHQILREYREYERTSTTVLNAYVGPRVSHYLDDLETLLASLGFEGRLLIMQSNGGIMAPDTAKRVPVAMMESGPVGGIIAAAEVSRDLGYRDVIAFDMGGTTAKVSLVNDNQPDIAQGYYIGGQASGHPVMLPVVDIVEVGAGGGSIAWIDDVGALKVGPRSAGGQPGPICYGEGGTEPTVTDANVVLGRISTTQFLGGEMKLDIEAASHGIHDKIAQPLAMSVTEAALGIIRIAVAEMGLAVRQVSVERGLDPRDYPLIAFGGAGPVHAVEIARELHIPTVIIPRVPGHFSALGMLLADLRHDYVRTYYRALEASDLAELEAIFAALIAEGRELLVSEGVGPDAITYQRFLDVRYVGQEFTIATPIDALEPEQIRSSFNQIHERRFGHQAEEEPVEIVNVRLTVRGQRKRLRLPPLSDRPGDALLGVTDVYFDDAAQPRPCPSYDRSRLAPNQHIDGPAIVVEYASTTLIHAADHLRVAPTGELIITLGAS